MGIYSRNRSGSFVNEEVKLNREYGPSDIGRIMYESVVNDNTIFDAIVMSDLQESMSLREGTLLEAEAKKFSKENAKKLLHSIGERLKAFWLKIKDIIKAAIRKFAAYILKDGKAFVDDFNAFMKDRKFDGTIKDVEVYDDSKFETFDISDLDQEVATSKTDDNLNTADFLKKLYKRHIGADCENDKEFRAKIKENCKEKRNYTNSDISGLCDYLKNASDKIKALKTEENNQKKNIDRIAKLLKDAEKDIDDNKDCGKIIKRIGLIASAYENVAASCISTLINMMQINVKTFRKVLGEVKKSATSTKEGKTEVQLNSVFIETDELVDAEEIDNILTNDQPEDPELDAQIAEIENSVE